MLSGSTVWPSAFLSQSAKRVLASRLADWNDLRNALSPASGLSLASCVRSVIQPSPIASVIVPESAGLHSRSQRRGVTQLVLLLNRSGKISARSFTVVFLSSSE